MSERDWNAITIADDLMFSTVMEDQNLCKAVLETLLGIHITHFTRFSGEHRISASADAKTVRLDIFAETDETLFDLEMQKQRPPALAKRTRLYQSAMDTHGLASGSLYTELKESYVLFICLFDCFKQGLPVYTFENQAREMAGLRLNDRAYKIFYNAGAWKSVRDAALRALLRYIREGEAGTELTAKLERRVQETRENADWRKSFMTWETEQRVREEESFKAGQTAGIAIGEKKGILIGEERGIRSKAEEAARKALALGLSIEQAAAITGLSFEEVALLQ